MVESDVDEIRGEYGDVLSKHYDSSVVSDNLTYWLVIASCINRQIALASAMPVLFKSRNLYALMPLVRLQLEGLLRLHAFRVVDDPEALASHFLIKGKNISDYKGGKLKAALFDSVLARSLDESGAVGMSDMYKMLCGWIHFSQDHFRSLVQPGEVREDEVPNYDINIGGYKDEDYGELYETLATAIPVIHKATVGLASELLEGMAKNNQTIH